MSLLRTILILIIIYYVIQIVTKYILPALFGTANNKGNEFSRKQQKQQKRAARHEGEVTIDYMPEKNRKANDGKGDYVDYEEVKD